MTPATLTWDRGEAVDSDGGKIRRRVELCESAVKGIREEVKGIGQSLRGHRSGSRDDKSLHDVDGSGRQ